MSAIAGLIDWRGRPAAGAVRRASDSLARQGRDGEGFWDEGSVALAWRQTVLTEEDSFDAQPRTGGAGRYRLVFDGRLDNREDLSRELGIAAAEARVLPDSAFALAAFEKWGEDCVEHLLGDFAFALWDAHARSLFLARDHIGQRPLHYHRGRGFVMFATMPSALFTNPEVPRDIDDEAFVLELAAVPMDKGSTLYRGISRVPLGHAALITEDALRLIRHWRPETLPEIRYRRDEDYVEAFRAVLDEAVRCRLRTIHPIGSQLSSGWDSSTVTATAARLLDGKALTAFTSVPQEGWNPTLPVREDPFLGVTDEGPVASLVARRFPSVEHVLVRGTGRLDLGALDRHADLFEHPKKAVNNIAWMERLYGDARGRGIRVMLVGTMGNRTISYDGLTLLPSLLRRGSLLRLAGEFYWLHRETRRSYKGLVSAAASPYLPDLVWNFLMSLQGREIRTKAMCHGLSRHAMNPEKLWEIARHQGINPANARRADDRIMRHISTQTPDVGQVLSNTLGAWDVDMRDPAADRRMMAFRVSIPEEQFLNRGRTKWLLRRAMDGILPPELINRTARARQSADWCGSAAQARGEMAEEIRRLGDNSRMAGLLDIPLLTTTVKDWPQALPQGDVREFAYRKFLIILGAARYMRRFIERP